MSKLELETTINYEHIHDNYEDSRGIVLVGGTRSSKTIAILQWIVIYCLTNHGKHIVIGRDTLKNLKRTTLKDFEAICYGLGDFQPLAPHMKLNKADLIAQIGTCTLEFIGLIDDPMRVYGLRSDRFYLNEAISTYKHTFNQLNQRCEEGWFMDCNPSEPNHWVYELERREDVQFFRTTYEDNPFLSDSIVEEIEAYEPTPENIERGTADKRMWSIYGKGEIYKGAEIIYPEWTTFDEDPTEYDQVFYGIDFGINHPLACIKVMVNGNNLYVREVVYKSGIMDLSLEVSPILREEQPIIDGNTYVICDSAELKSIHTLIQDDIPAFGVKKPPGSVLTGIRKVAKYNMHVHIDSTNIMRELNNYKWKIDTKTDSILDVPVKLNDDAMDAIRYVVYTYL